MAATVEALLDGSSSPPVWNESAMVAQVLGKPPPPGETSYSGIQQLEPGCVLTVTAASLEVARYWGLPQNPPALRLRSDQAYAAAYRELLFTVAAEYAPSASCGITLSGGLDSTSVAVALARAMPAERLTAIRWEAPELPDADEGDRSAKVGRSLGLGDASVRADHCWTLRGADLRPPRSTPFVNFYAELWGETFHRARQLGLRILFTGASGDNLFGCGVTPYADLWLTGRWGRLVDEIRGDGRFRGLSTLRTFRLAVISPIAYAWGPQWWRRRWTPPVAWLGERYRRHYRPSASGSRWILPGRQHRMEVLNNRFLAHVMTQATANAGSVGAGTPAPPARPSPVRVCRRAAYAPELPRWGGKDHCAQRSARSASRRSR